MSGHPGGCPCVHFLYGYAGQRLGSSNLWSPRGSKPGGPGAGQASCRKDWSFELEDPGIEVLITYRDMVGTSLDLLSWPTVVFLQSGYAVYTLQKTARRSWRIGQKEPVDVCFLGYGGTAQIACLRLMAKKIAVAQSTSGDMPETGLGVLNQDGDSIEVALAKRLAG